MLQLPHPAHLASQTDFADDHRAPVQRNVVIRRGDRHRHREVDRRLDDAEPSGHAHEHIAGREVQPRALLEHGQQHGKAARVHTGGHPPRHAEPRASDQRLHFEKDRSRPLQRGRDRRSRHALAALFQKKLRRVRDRTQSLVPHLEHADFVGRTEPVLGRPEETIVMIPIAFEIEHRVHHVLHDPRSGHHALLGDVSDQDDRDLRALGEFQKVERVVAHLSHASRRAVRFRAVQRLHRVHDDHVRGSGRQRRRHRLHAGRGEHLQAFVDPAEAPAAQSELALRFLRADVEHHETLRGVGRSRLQERAWTCPLRDRRPPARGSPAPARRPARGRTPRCRCDSGEGSRRRCRPAT